MSSDVGTQICARCRAPIQIRRGKFLRFCPSCRAPLASGTGAAPSSSAVPWLIAGGAVVVVGLLVVVAIVFVVLSRDSSAEPAAARTADPAPIPPVIETAEPADAGDAGAARAGASPTARPRAPSTAPAAPTPAPTAQQPSSNSLIVRELDLAKADVERNCSRPGGPFTPAVDVSFAADGSVSRVFLRAGSESTSTPTAACIRARFSSIRISVPVTGQRDFTRFLSIPRS